MDPSDPIARCHCIVPVTETGRGERDRRTTRQRVGLTHAERSRQLRTLRLDRAPRRVRWRPR